MPHQNKHGLKIRPFRSEENSQFYFHILAGNGRIVAPSEGYQRRADRDRTVNLLLTAKMVLLPEKKARQKTISAT